MAANQLATPVLTPEAELAGAPFEQEQAVYEQPSLISRFVERVDAARDSITSSPLAYKLGALGASAVSLVGGSLVAAEVARGDATTTPSPLTAEPFNVNGAGTYELEALTPHKNYSNVARFIQEEISKTANYTGKNDINPANKMQILTDNVSDVNGKCSSNKDKPMFKKEKRTPTSDTLVGCDGHHSTSHGNYGAGNFEDKGDDIAAEVADMIGIDPNLISSSKKIKSNGKNASISLEPSSKQSDEPMVRKVVIDNGKLSIKSFRK